MDVGANPKMDQKKHRRVVRQGLSWPFFGNRSAGGKRGGGVGFRRPLFLLALEQRPQSRSKERTGEREVTMIPMTGRSDPFYSVTVDVAAGQCVIIRQFQLTPGCVESSVTCE